MFPSPLIQERYADGAVHAIGLAATIIGCLTLILYASARFDTPMVVACSIYALCMTASFTTSASYHMLPQHHWRSGLRRLDHAAIYALIAGTFTPLLIFVDTITAYFVLAAVWILSVPAMLFKILGEQIEPRWSLASYLGLGWIGIVALPDFSSILPLSALVAIFAGGFFYSFGTIFYRRKEQRFRYSIWHSFVLLGTSSFFAAIWISLFQK